MLKLFKEKFIFSQIVYSYIDNQIDVLPHYQPYQRYSYDEDLYKIEKEEEEEFTNFWRKFINIPYSTTYSLYRFHLADYRPYSMDTYIDYVESLESLLVPDGDEGNISKKFKNRGASILANVESKNKIKKNLFELYDRRSTIVHGKEKMTDIEKWTTEDWKAPIKLIRCYDRKIIKYVVDKNILDFDERKSEMKRIYDQNTTTDLMEA